MFYSTDLRWMTQSKFSLTQSFESRREPLPNISDLTSICLNLNFHFILFDIDFSPIIMSYSLCSLSSEILLAVNKTF